MSYADWRGRFAEAMDPRFYNITWLDFMYETNRLGFWESPNAAIMAEIKTYPAGGREVHGIVAAGELDGIRALIPYAEQWGRENGACIATIDSHPAWAKLLKDDGYHVTRQTVAKEL